MPNTLDATIARRFDFIVKQNQTFNVVLTLLDDSNAPINLNGASVKMSVRESHCGCGGGCADQAYDDFDIKRKQDLIPSIGGGSFNILTFSDTIILVDNTYKYDLLVEYPSGQKQYLLHGTFKVKKSYTSI